MESLSLSLSFCLLVFLSVSVSVSLCVPLFGINMFTLRRQLKFSNAKRLFGLKKTLLKNFEECFGVSVSPSLAISLSLCFTVTLSLKIHNSHSSRCPLSVDHLLQTLPFWSVTYRNRTDPQSNTFRRL